MTGGCGKDCRTRMFRERVPRKPNNFGGARYCQLGSPWRPQGGPVLEKGPLDDTVFSKKKKKKTCREIHKDSTILLEDFYYGGQTAPSRKTSFCRSAVVRQITSSGSAKYGKKCLTQPIYIRF